jgi:hypothetical protein
MKYLAILLALFCFIQLRGEDCKNFNGMKENRVYLEAHQIEIVDGTILVKIDDHLWVTRQLNCDESGVYCQVENLGPVICDTCPNGHNVWCRRCNGCAVRWCLLGRCKCVAWE